MVTIATWKSGTPDDATKSGREEVLTFGEYPCSINDGARCIRCGYDTSVDSAHVCVMPATLSEMISQRTYHCDWVQDDIGNWDTMCGNAFTVNDGTPSENGMKYCPYCGKPLNEVMP